MKSEYGYRDQYELKCCQNCKGPNGNSFESYNSTLEGHQLFCPVINNKVSRTGICRKFENYFTN